MVGDFVVGGEDEEAFCAGFCAWACWDWVVLVLMLRARLVVKVRVWQKMQISTRTGLLLRVNVMMVNSDSAKGFDVSQFSGRPQCAACGNENESAIEKNWSIAEVTGRSSRKGLHITFGLAACQDLNRTFCHIPHFETVKDNDGHWRGRSHGQRRQTNNDRLPIIMVRISDTSSAALAVT